MTDVCCLSVSLHLSVPWYLSEGPDSSKYPGINEAMNDVLTCHKFHLFRLVNTFKCKTKTKTKPKTKCSCDFILRSVTLKRKDKKKKKDSAYFQNRQFATCNQSLFELRHTCHSSQRWSYCLVLMKNVRMCTVCPVCSGMRHCEHIIKIYVDKYVFICLYEYVIWERCSYI